MNNYTVVKLQQILATEDFAEEDAEADDDLIAALREGIADRDSGNLRTLDQVEESVRAALAARHQKAAA